jgi:hypothetical protein
MDALERSIGQAGAAIPAKGKKPRKALGGGASRAQAQARLWPKLPVRTTKRSLHESGISLSKTPNAIPRTIKR